MPATQRATLFGSTTPQPSWSGAERGRSDPVGRPCTQRAAHERLTAEIVALEMELNDRVYRLFDLTPDESRLIEATTKYRYGEV
jgi:hypothetical protein